MDEFRKRIDEICKQEDALYEGLKTSHALYYVDSILKNSYNISCDYKNNSFRLIYNFDNDLKIAEQQLDNILQLTNNLGWYPANMAYGEKYLNIVKWDKFKDSFKAILNKGNNSIKFLFEPKYDIFIVHHNRFLYHLTPTLFVNKILKSGLIPKTLSKKSYHPDRIYLAINPNDAYNLIPEFQRLNKIKEWTILEIDTKPIDFYLQIYRDQNFNKKGYYTLNTITPICISIYWPKPSDEKNSKEFQDFQKYKEDIDKIDRSSHMGKRGIRKKPGDKTPNYEY